MNFYVNWHSAFKSIKNNGQRSLLTMFGIIIGVSSVITILAIGRGFEKNTISNLTNNDGEGIEIQIDFEPYDPSFKENGIDFFQETDFFNVEQIDGVEKVKYYDAKSDIIYTDVNIGENTKSKKIKLIEHESDTVIEGRKLTILDNEIANKVVVIDSITATELYGSSNLSINRGIEIEGKLFTIVGVFQAADQEDMLYMPEGNIQIPKTIYTKYFEPEKDTSSIIVTLNSTLESQEKVDAITNKLEVNGTMKNFGTYQTFDSASLTNGISAIIQNLTYFISVVAGISLIIAGVGVMNMMYISVSERTKEIGIRRALGATQQSIRIQFLTEGFILTSFGGAVGYIIGIFSAYLIGSLINVPVSVDMFTISVAIGVSSIVGVTSSFLPASDAAKKELIEIIR